MIGLDKGTKYVEIVCSECWVRGGGGGGGRGGEGKLGLNARTT